MQTSWGMRKPTHLLKKARLKNTSTPHKPHEFAHSTPYYYQSDDCPSMETIPDKGPIRLLEKHLTKHDKNIKLEFILILYPNIDNELSN